jgi:ribokinase
MHVLLIGGVSMDLLFQLAQRLDPALPVIQATHFAAHVGGKAFNLGVVLRRLFPALTVHVLAAVGGEHDLFSAALRQAVSAADLSPAYLRSKPAHSAPIVGIFNAPHSETVTIPYEATGHALDENDFTGLDWASYDVVLATGEIRPSVAFAAFERVKAAQPAARTVYNAAPAHLLAGQAALLAQHPIDDLFLNHHEAHTLLGSVEADPGARLAAITRIPQICLTLGARGGQCYTPTERWQFPAFEVAVQNPVGAGDTFVAAYLGAQLTGLPQAIALRYAAAAAAIACVDAVAIGEHLTPAAINALIAAQGTQWANACQVTRHSGIK